MKNTLSICSAVLLAASYTHAQNLVPNPGFEELLHIPCNCQQQGDMEHNVAGWKQGAESTADILTLKAQKDCYAHPLSNGGYKHGNEKPHSGETMAMIMTTANSGNWREYVGTTLTTPLEAGSKYYVEAWVSLVEGSGFATNNIGFLFRTGDYFTEAATVYYGTPQFNHTTIITTSNGWVKIGGTFTATENYTNVVIGNFLPQEQLAKQVNKVEGTYSRNGDMAAYYIDDIVVRRAGNLSATGDTLVAIGNTATFLAKGGSTYKWVDVKNPNVVLGTTAEFKIPVHRKTTFRVSSGDDEVEITVNVRKSGPVYRDELNGRKVRKGRSLIVHNEEITIQVHDKNEVDGDSISLFYGDSLVAQHIALTKKKQSFTIKVNRHQPQQIILYAENLGSVPPNTAEMTIRDGKESTSIILGSDFKWSDSVMITYKE